jgi:D-sedoheptulose 7-phosphate isomerase
VPIVLPAYRELIAHRLTQRNLASETFFAGEADRLARVCRDVADRFTRGGRLLAFGTGPGASDAQHIAVEFVHPVLVGKRALPAADLSGASPAAVSALVRPDDVVVGFGEAESDERVGTVLRHATRAGALAVGLPGTGGTYSVSVPESDPFIRQEIIEVLYHTLWESVHVFLEGASVGHGGGDAGFLYPFLAETAIDGSDPGADVAASIRSKAACDVRLREEIAAEQADTIAAAVLAVRDRLDRGASILCFGNGGSGTDATDLAHDLVASPKGYAAIPALSLAADAATLTAIANDIGSEAIFLRQIIAHGRPQDVALAISTSGGSHNIISALVQARALGLLTIALLGYDGGDVLRHAHADYAIVVRSDYIPRIQEVHASVYHVMLDLLHEVGLQR